MSIASCAPALAYLRRAGRRVGPRRVWLAAAAPRLVEDRLPGPWRTERVTVTGTGVVLALVRNPSTGRRVVLKVPSTVEAAPALRRQAAVLDELHADPRLAGWCAVVPRGLGRGRVNGRDYWVEEALAGRPPTVSLVRGGRAGGLLEAGARLAEELHARTAAERVLDRATVDAWVDRPAGRVEEYLTARRCPPERVETLGRIRGELAAFLTGRTVRTSWIHGDFWPGNLLVSGAAITGAVDWDQAHRGQAPLHDLLHLHVLARRMATGDELGEVVVRALRRGVADAIGVAPQRVAPWLGGLPDRPAVLLYWLRHVSLFICSEGHGDNPRWLRDNVDRVLAQA
jgi:aminoglycoside phosphotransferase (APT) family kinase protein